jgi:uncharacterized protein YaaN involved in tellurite resistance
MFMSELNLSVPSTPAPAAASPQSTGASTDLVLAPPAPVQVVEPEQAAGALPVEDAKRAELAQRASAFVADLSSLDTRSPEFTQKVAAVSNLGAQEMRASAAVSNRLLERPAAAMAKTGKGGKAGGGDAQTRVSNTLIDLRNVVTDLDPNRADLRGVKKILKFIPGGDKIDRYFAKYQSAQSHINAIIKALDSGQDDLRKDNAAIETEKANMWAMMGKLSEYNALAAELDAAIEQKIAELEAGGRTEDANNLRSEALFPIRQRRQDIMTQAAVNVQGYMALDLIRRNNLELIKGVDRAQTTTVAALRTAVIVSQALARQKLVLDQISALNTTTSNLIEKTSEQLRVQGGQINQQAAASTVDVAKLEAAFNNVFATMDALDTFRTQAVTSMADTVKALETQIDRAQPYLSRIRDADQAAQQ